MADLQVRAVSSPSPQEAPGSRMIASATVRNAGDRTAPASRLGFYLSRDRRKGSGDFRLRPRPLVRSRRPGSRARLLRTFTVPTRVPTGSFALIACADDTRRIRERRERNNCRSASRRIRIVPRSVPTPLGIVPITVPGTVPGTVTAGPSLAVSGLPNGSVTSDTTPTYSGTAQSASAGIARVEASLDGGVFSTSGVNCSGCGSATASWTFTPAPLGEGPHSFAFRAIDSRGTSSPTITRTLSVDTTRPTFNSITATPGSTSVTATFSEPLACITVNPSDFSARIGTSAVTVASVSCSASGDVITLTLGSAPAAGQTVAITLSGIVSDPAENAAPVPTTQTDVA